MTPTTPFRDFELHSDDAWNLVCSIETVGSDLLCRVHGGDTHIGAVALAQWTGERASAECLVADGHREDRIAIHSAHQLCGASHRQVVCVAGLHFDGITMAEIDAISQSAFDLTTQAARRVADRRLKADATASALLARIKERSDGRVRDVESFLATPWRTLVDTHGPAAAASRAENFGGRVGIFAPLYLSNACQNNCVYCGFRRSARFQRTTLSTQDSVREAAFLAAKGFRVLDLVTGEVPTDRFVDYVGDVTRAILENTDIDAVNLNIGSLSSEQFERLRAAGATGYHLYQESYDPDVYFGVHQSGGKRDMASRLAGLHRAIDAGFDKVGLGLLLGLGPPAVELARMIGHADVIRADAPDVTIGFSLPRIRPVDEDCSYEPGTRVSDADFMKCMLFLRLRFPGAHLTVTTRERRELRDALLPIGITKVSAEVSTSPGGYTHSVETETGQFPISDGRTLDEMKWAIEAAHLIPILGA